MHIFLHPYQIFTYNGETVTNKGGCHLLKNYDLLKLIFQRIIDEIDIGLHVVDENGTSVVYNKKMSQIEGMDVNDVLGKNVLDVFTFASQYDSTLLQALHHGKTNKNVKQTYFNNKGQEITTVNHTFPIMENGNTKGAVEIAKDVTKLERLIRENMNKTENTKYTFDSLIGVSPAFKEVIEHAKRATGPLPPFSLSATPEPEKNCSPKVYITEASGRLAHSSHKTAQPSRKASSKAFYSARPKAHSRVPSIARVFSNKQTVAHFSLTRSILWTSACRQSFCARFKKKRSGGSALRRILRSMSGSSRR